MLLWPLDLKAFSEWAADGLLNCKGFGEEAKNSVTSLNTPVGFEKHRAGILLILVTLEKLTVCQQKITEKLWWDSSQMK